MPVLFYPSKTHDRLNGFAFTPELYTGRVMLNPKYKVTEVLPQTEIICDSGAFQDIDTHIRLTPQMALERQLRFRDRFKHVFEATCIYDQMQGVDEQIVDGKKIKQRGTEESGRKAVLETLRAAEYYASKRSEIGRIVFIAQGINPSQYVQECVLPMLPMMTPDDYFGFGGFCIIGRQSSLKPLFYATLQQTLPYLKERGIRRVHLLGVQVADAVNFAACEVQKYGMELSLDGSSMEINAVFGKVYDGNTAMFRKRWEKEDKMVKYHPNPLAHQNTAQYQKWCLSL